MHQPSAPFNLRALLAHERRVIPYNLRRHCQFASNRFVNSQSDLQFDAVLLNGAMLQKHWTFKPLSRISFPTYGQMFSFYQKFIALKPKFKIDNFSNFYY
jgi:hypothetical protein